MKIKHLYLTLFIIGTVIPYYEFIGFIIENGANFKLLSNQLLATKISRFFAYDVIISAIVLLIFILKEKEGINNYWLSVLITFTIGVSDGLPLFLFQRELKNRNR